MNVQKDIEFIILLEEMKKYKDKPRYWEAIEEKMTQNILGTLQL